MDSADLSRDSSGTRSFSQFIVELAGKQPSLVLPSISLLLSHLDGDVSFAFGLDFVLQLDLFSLVISILISSLLSFTLVRIRSGSHFIFHLLVLLRGLAPSHLINTMYKCENVKCCICNVL